MCDADEHITFLPYGQNRKYNAYNSTSPVDVLNSFLVLRMFSVSVQADGLKVFQDRPLDLHVIRVLLLCADAQSMIPPVPRSQELCLYPRAVASRKKECHLAIGGVDSEVCVTEGGECE